MDNPPTTRTDFHDTGIPEKHLKCLKALFLTDPQDDLAAIHSAKGDKVDGTCEWILTQHQYTSWLVEGSPQLLWLSGAPGIGKTMISSFLVDELTPIAERSRQMTLAYYFCDDKYQERRTAITILRGLLLQILRQRPVLFKHIQTSFDMSGNGLFTNFHALWRIFIAIVHDPEVGKLYCLVDALDECERDSRELFLVEFTKLYCSQKSKSPLVKFIITSRRENDIVESLSAVSPPIWHIQVDSGKVNDDVSKFIDTRVNELSTRKGYSAELQNEIKSALKNKAEGTFLYVSLVLSILAKTKVQSLVRRKLQNLPEDLNKLYDKILSQIDRDCEEIAMFVFRWVAVARRPLTVKELAFACALNTSTQKIDTLPPDDFADEFEDIYKCCEPFVYLDTECGTINLVHQSAKDYLLGAYLQAKGNLSQYHIVQDKTNFLMFRTCWKFLSFEEFRQGTMIFERDAHHCLHETYLKEDFINKYSFLRYARPQWQEHAFAASPALATDSTFWNKYLAGSPTLRDTLLLAAAAKGEYMIVQRMLENGAQMNSRDKNGSTPVLLASREGHEKVLKLLLEWLNAWKTYPHLVGQRPLHEELLLSQDDIGVNAQNKNARTPLLWAARNGHTAVVKLLLSQDHIAVNSQDCHGNTPLIWAAFHGYEGVVKLLLSQDDIAVNSQNEYGDSPLLRAASSGHEGVIRILLTRNDIEVNSRKCTGKTALMAGLRGGYEAVVRLLLTRNDIEVNSRDEDGRTALVWAVRNGYKEGVFRVLLSRDDINVNSQDKDGLTALMWAVRNGYEGVVGLLLSRDDIYINSRDKDGWTALVWAVWNGYEAEVRLLFSRSDIDVNIRDDEGRTALLWAILLDSDAVVRLLLSRSDIQVGSRDLEEIRSWGCFVAYDPFMKLLRHKMAELNEAGAQ